MVLLRHSSGGNKESNEIFLEDNSKNITDLLHIGILSN